MKFKKEGDSWNFSLGGWPHIIMGLLTANIGYSIHGSLGWSIVDFLFYPIAIIKWFICHEITLNIIKQSFNWFF